jgi:hypothetical protein
MQMLILDLIFLYETIVNYTMTNFPDTFCFYIICCLYDVLLEMKVYFYCTEIYWPE